MVRKKLAERKFLWALKMLAMLGRCLNETGNLGDKTMDDNLIYIQIMMKKKFKC